MHVSESFLILYDFVLPVLQLNKGNRYILGFSPIFPLEFPSVELSLHHYLIIVLFLDLYIYFGVYVKINW